VAVWRAGEEGQLRAELLPNSEGGFLTPSAISLDTDGSVLIGNAAWQRRVTHPELTATEFKRDMGSTRTYRLGKNTFTPEQLSSMILQSLKADAESALGVPVTHAVISVPAYFNDTQRNATLAAARLADLTVTRLVNEPTAAAVAYGLADDTDDDAPKATLVFDLGGGTFDISIVELFDGVIEIKASTGDNYLGGEDFTGAIATALAKACDLDDAARAKLSAEERARFRSAAERVKHELSNSATATAKFQLNDEPREINFSEQDFEKCAEALLERVRRPVRQALRDARINPDKLDNIVLVGGSTRMPLVRKLVTQLFGRFPETRIHPDEAIALGAATQAALMARDVSLDEVLLTDVSPFTLGVDTASRNSAGEIVEGVFSPIIERNTIIPVSRESSYQTMHDFQENVNFKIYQGEHRFVKDNVSLGELDVPVPKRRAGEVSVIVRFTYDASGMLEIDINVDGTDTHVNTTLLGNAARLDPAEIEKRKAELAKLKFHPRDDLPNRTVMERADRLYAELTGHQRDQIGQAMNDFAAILNSQDINNINAEREQFEAWLSEIELRL